MPKYDECSVKNVFPLFKEDKEVMKYMMDAYAENRYPSRHYFFSILNTIHPMYVSRMVKHANKVRNAVDVNEQRTDVVEIVPEWWEKLKELPYFSSKSFPDV